MRQDPSTGKWTVVVLLLLGLIFAIGLLCTQSTKAQDFDWRVKGEKTSNGKRLVFDAGTYLIIKQLGLDKDTVFMNIATKYMTQIVDTSGTKTNTWSLKLPYILQKGANITFIKTDDSTLTISGQRSGCSLFPGRGITRSLGIGGGCLYVADRGLKKN